ncbi:MAG TPA: DUF4174 domain-containing protein [Hymenobacter sp.]|jgi:hypothetical protein
MKRLLLLLAAPLLLPGLLVVAAQTPKPSRLAETLRASRWQQRVLLVAAPSAGHADFQHQKKLLATSAAGLATRDFLVLDVLYDQLSSADQQFLAHKLGVRPPTFAAVLIGKDGGVKLRSAQPIAPQTLFDTVDQMPMRRAEMQRATSPQSPK